METALLFGEIFGFGFAGIILSALIILRKRITTEAFSEKKFFGD